MQKYLIKGIRIVNENRVTAGDVRIVNGRIDKISSRIEAKANEIEIVGDGKYLLPGAIDDQVHFREPGLTEKATIYTESKAAVAGGVTSFMEMPNTQPPAFTQALLEDKYAIAAATSLANFSFYMGTANNNADEVLRTNEKKDSVCGVKIFMGSSTGNLLVDNYPTLDHLFANLDVLVATHCEEERIIQENKARLQAENRVLVPADHPIIRDAEACFESSFKAVQLAKKHGTRLHILHISTARELPLFTNLIPLPQKRITAEVCVHHLHFTADDYATQGNLIKCNPAIKAAENKEALWAALLDDRLDVIATDHAPHLWPEKTGPYESAHAGVPLVQHSLLLMLDYFKQGKISIETIVSKMSHAVADCFNISERGYIREGYFADLVIVDPEQHTTVSKENILYKCGWSPFTGKRFGTAITHSFVNGHLAYANGVWDESYKGRRLRFNRDQVF